MNQSSDEATGAGGESSPPEDYFAMQLGPREEPVVTGTLFFVIIILMIIGAVWVIMYLRLLDR